MSVATSDFEEGDFCFSIRELEIIKLRFGRVNRAIFMIFGLPANARRMALLSHNVAREIITLNQMTNVFARQTFQQLPIGLT